MSFSYSGGLITQTGTDIDLSGLTGLTGVTVTSFGNYNLYIIDASTILIVTGDLTIDPSVESASFLRDAANTANSPLRVESTGILRIGVLNTIGGIDVYSTGTALNFSGLIVANWGNWMLVVKDGGQLIWNGGTIRTTGTVYIDDGGYLTVNKGIMSNIGTNSNIPVEIPQLRLGTTSVANNARIDIFDLELTGIDYESYLFSKNAWNTAVFALTNGSFQTFSNSFPEVTLSNFNVTRNISPYDIFSTTSNASNAEDVIVQNTTRPLNYGSQAGKNLYVKVQRQLSITPKDLDGVSVSKFSYYGQDFDSGNRTVGPMNATDGSQNDTITKTYSALNQTTPIVDNMLLELGILIGGGTADIIIDDRTNSGLIPLSIASYNESITLWSNDLYDLDTLTQNQIMTPDLLITEPSRAVVESYTDIDDAYKLYDRAKAFLCESYSGENAPYISRNGAQVDLNDKLILINPSAVSVLDVVGNTIIIKSNVFTGGAITSGSGSVATVNGALLNGGTFDCEITYNSGAGTTLTDVTCTGVLEFTTAGTYTLDGCTINEVTNTSGGNVILNLAEGSSITTVTGPNIDTAVSLTIAHNAENGSFAYLNIDKWNVFSGVFVDHVTAQATLSSAVNGDYYLIDPLMDGNRTDAGYYDGSSWVVNGSPIIHEGFIASTVIGGTGLPNDHVLNLSYGTNIRVCIDDYGKYMSLTEINVTSTTVPILLEVNPNVDISYVPSALPYVLQFELEGPDTNSVMTMKVPSFNANVGDSSDIGLAGAATELARLSEGSLSGALISNSPDLVEITSVGVLSVKNDTLRIVPLDSVVAGEKVSVPLYLNVQNYTIDPVPVTNANTFVCFEHVSMEIVNGATVVNPGDLRADLTTIEANQDIINNGVKKASKLIPHKINL
jgi:hypothetical protein